MLKFFTIPKKLMVAALAITGLVVGVAGTTYALTTLATGSYSDRQYFAANDTSYTIPSSVASGTWVALPGMTRTVTVPAGSSRLIDARFAAESMCTGGSWCAVRIVTINSSGAVTELYPQSGTDFAFDSPSSDLWEGHAMERNSRYFLPEGTYRVQVQAAKVGAATFRLDEMHLAVEAVRP